MSGAGSSCRIWVVRRRTPALPGVQDPRQQETAPGAQRASGAACSCRLASEGHHRAKRRALGFPARLRGITRKALYGTCHSLRSSEAIGSRASEFPTPCARCNPLAGGCSFVVTPQQHPVKPLDIGVSSSCSTIKCIKIILDKL